MKLAISLFRDAETAEKAGNIKKAANLYRKAASACDTDIGFRIAVGNAERLEAEAYPSKKTDRPTE